MTKPNVKYPALSDIDIEFEDHLECISESSCDDKSYTFDNQNTLKQAIANIKLESLTMPKDVEELLNRALTDSSITTEQVLDLLRKHHSSY